MGNYEDSGFDAFLSRSIDSLPQTSLDSQGPQSTQFTFDRGQTSGGFGDSFRIGNIVFDGKAGTITIASGKDAASIVIDGPNRRIVVSDETNNRIIIGSFNTS